MRNADASKYDILYDLPEGEYNPAEVGGIRTRTIRAGNTIEVECYPLLRIGNRAREEAAARHRQRPCQEQLNRRNAEKRIRRLIENNFTPEDYVLTLTWDYGRIDRFTMSEADAARAWGQMGFPDQEEDARRALNNYYRRIKTRMKQQGRDPRAFMHLYVLEPTRSKTDGRWHYHFHLVLHAPGLSDLDLKDLWPHGFARVDRLSFRDEGPARLAHYLTKQHTTEEVNANGQRRRRWGHSLNLKEPAETVSDRKISRTRAARIAADVQHMGRAIFEAIYPGYSCVETPVVRYSDFMPGAYIYARLRRIDTAPPWTRQRAEAGRRRLRQQNPTLCQHRQNIPRDGFCE